jgi:hypothetical protein
MANNSMWLVCRGCGKALLLGKVHQSAYSTHHEDMNKKLNEFYNLHSFCDKNNEVSNENQFELAYDFAKEEGIKEY